MASFVTMLEALEERLNARLITIHDLVNSNLAAVKDALDAARRSELSALEGSVRLAKELVGLKRAAGVPVSEAALAEIDDAQSKVDSLRATVDEVSGRLMRGLTQDPAQSVTITPSRN